MFQKNISINCNGKLVNFDRPKVMGIVNLTPDSFYDGSVYNTNDLFLKLVEKHLKEGADFIDIGAISSRPGAHMLNFDEEKKRLYPSLEKIISNFPEALISIDTFRSDIARGVVDRGAAIINDISAGSLDEKMFSTIAELQVPYIIMHMRGTPETMQNNTKYNHLIDEIVSYFSNKLNQLHLLGINDIILDPGFGFGKDLIDNYEILKKLAIFDLFNKALLVGLSRKSMFHKHFDITAEESLNATSAAHMVALRNGAKILRVHDVKEAVQCVEIDQLTR